MSAIPISYIIFLNNIVSVYFCVSLYWAPICKTNVFEHDNIFRDNECLL